MDNNPYRRPESEDQFVVTKRLVPTALKWVVGIGAVLALLVSLLLPTVRSSPEAGRRSTCLNKLSQIGLALHNYHDAYGVLPPAYTTDANGKPLHSWRTLILPFLEEGRLYGSIDLTKPWDDPVNAHARSAKVDSYQCPSPEGSSRTTYLAVVTPDSCLRPNASKKLSDITDGLRTTWLVLEVAEDDAVPWMSPLDADEQTILSIQPDSKLPHPGGVNALLADRSVHYVDADTSAADRRAMISIAGGEPTPEEWK